MTSMKGSVSKRAVSITENEPQPQPQPQPRNRNRNRFNHLRRIEIWRTSSPLSQVVIICIVVFTVVGMNSVLLMLGAGGSSPLNIPIVDKANIMGASCTIIAALFGGSINNKIGPKYTLVIAGFSYPMWAGSLWWLDKTHGTLFAYIAGIYHGIGAGLFYCTTGFIVSSYSTEANRGRYIAWFWASSALGAALSATIVLAITTTSSSITRVPGAVYVTIICVESAGVLCAFFLSSASRIKRHDGRPIAHFKSLTWIEESRLLIKDLMTIKILLLAPAFIASNMPVSLTGSLNGFRFDARTRALVTLNYQVFVVCGWVIIAYLCDAKSLGNRRKRAFKAAVVVCILLVSTWSALLQYLATHRLDRGKKPHGTDWTGGLEFSWLFVLYSFLGMSWAIFQGYIIWVVSTFSNEPSKLSRFSGFIEAMRGLGYAVSFGIDSNSVAFLTEAATYFSLLMVGLVFCVLSSAWYMTSTEYGKEHMVVVPEDFDLSLGPLSQQKNSEVGVSGSSVVI